MNRAFVVLEPTESGRKLLREAGELVAGVDAHLEVLFLLTEEEYENDLEMLKTIATEERTSYEKKPIGEYAAQMGQKIVSEILDDLDIDYAVDGQKLDENHESDHIVEAAEEKDCDHMFITGAQRSPTGKAIFGDVAQSVILNFDGYTTILTTAGD